MAVIVSLHAHPDDETLLTGGWLAQRAADGDRVVVVFATDGSAGLARADLRIALGIRRREEGEAAARALGASRTIWLGYDDSGMAAEPSDAPRRLTDASVSEVAHRVAEVLDEEGADVLTGYDANGGYGHPDHVAVHHAARAAQTLATRRPTLMEATREREGLLRWVRLARPLSRVLAGLTLPGDDIYTATSVLRGQGGLRVDVRDQLGAKRAALRAHRSQAGGGLRTVGLLLALPRPLAARAMGTEWFLVVS